jgi:hypothetical protein
MKRLLALAAICAASCCLHAQVVDTTVCDVLKNPQSFNGKTVRIKGTAVASFDQFVVKGAGCGQPVNAIWLDYPQGTKAKAGPAVMLHLLPASNFGGTFKAADQAPVTLDKNKDFKQFDSRLSTPYKGDGICLGCNRYAVNATLVGRLDAAAQTGLRRDGAGKIMAVGGFGSLNAYPARLVLQSVSDVSPQEIDYSKTAAATKGDTAPSAGGGDSLASAHMAAKAFGPGNALGEQVERAAAAFGKQGDENGVNLRFGVANEAAPEDDAKSAHSSPDGVVFDCMLDMDRLKGNALPIAISYVGTQIADIRSPKAAAAEPDLYTLEYHGWQTAVLTTIGIRLKTLTLPGDYLLWNFGWPPAERDKSLESALSNFLANEELVRK